MLNFKEENEYNIQKLIDFGNVEIVPNAETCSPISSTPANIKEHSYTMNVANIKYKRINGKEVVLPIVIKKYVCRNLVYKYILYPLFGLLL